MVAGEGTVEKDKEEEAADEKINTSIHCTSHYQPEDTHNGPYSVSSRARKVLLVEYMSHIDHFLL